MKLLLISYFFPPHGGGGVMRAVETVRLLSRRGWEITVLAGPEDGWWVRDDSLLERIPDPVKVIRPGQSGLASMFGALRGGGGRNEGGVRLLKRLAAWLPVVDGYSGWSRAAVRAALELDWRPDWIVSSSPPESSHLAAKKLSAALGCRWAADFRDPWTEAIYRRQPTALHRMYQLARERRVIANAGLVISTTGETSKNFSGRYPELPREKFVCVPNGYDPDEFASFGGERPRRLPLRLIHAGNLSLDRDISPLLEAIARVNRDGVLCRLELAGQVAAGTIDRLRNLRLEGAVTISGYVPRPKLLERLAASHAGVIVEAFRPGAELVVPGKLYDYFGASLPTLALAPPGALSNILERTGGGVAATEPDPARLENLLRQMIENVKRGGMALRPPDPSRIEQYQRPELVARLAELLEQC